MQVCINVILYFLLIIKTNVWVSTLELLECLEAQCASVQHQAAVHVSSKSLTLTLPHHSSAAEQATACADVSAWIPSTGRPKLILTFAPNSLGQTIFTGLGVMERKTREKQWS